MKTLPAIDKAIARVEKPEHFTNFTHCDECREHDDTLRNHDRDSISLTELGNPAWDPICFVNSHEGFQYYLPVLARLATGSDDEYYLDQFLFHLNEDRISALPREGRDALAEFLTEVVETMAEVIEGSADVDNLLATIVRLQEDC